MLVIPGPPPQAVPDDPLVLGIDPGSTTTKAALLDRSRRRGFSPFFMEGVYERYAQRSIILKPVDLSHMLLASSQQFLAETASQGGMQPGLLAFGKGHSA